MGKKILCILMLILILIGVLNTAFTVKLTSAKDVENNILNYDFMGKNGEVDLLDDYFTSKRNNDLNTNGEGIFERKSNAQEDRWNFNDTSEWSKFVYVAGNRTRLIVGINGEHSANLSKLEEVAERHQAKIVNTISIEGEVIAVVVDLPLIFVTAFIEEIRMMKLASYVEPNMKVQIQFVPNDPYWSFQWGPQKIEADWAWNITIGNPSVLVAIVDTGIDYNHPDLVGNYVPFGYDWVNNDPDPLDDFGHGTHCAGIIAAVLNNSIGVAGLAQVRIMAEKSFDSWGYGYWDWIANGIIHAVDMGADIISMSFGGYADSELLHDAIEYAYSAGVLLVAAAGNDNTNMGHYPACYDEVIAVAATDQYDNKAYFSNWGEWVELAAPGVDIYSTMPTYYVTMNDMGYSMNYDYMSGTSMACPHVAGLVALVLTLYPNKTSDWVRLWLRNTADDLGDPGFDVYYGYGRINARKAVEQTLPSHELIAYEWTTPPYVEPGALATINATILNFGENSETNIETQLLANNTLVDSVEIDFLASGESANISLTWNPTVEGLYNVTLYVVPVPEETSIENNMLSKHIYVGTPIKAVVLHSAGNVVNEIITNWQVLSSEWYLFGDTMIYIDYTTLNKEDITYEDIAATEADVLIISCAFDLYSGWEFTDSEIEAITQYVYEGHGLIVTSGTFYYSVPNNNKLAPLFGLKETITWAATETDLLHLVNATHPLFSNVPDPFVFLRVSTALPEDGRWDQNELLDGKYLALGHYQESAIVMRRGLVYISPWLEVIPPYYHHHLQLLYNAITWSRYQKPQHDLKVSLKAPFHLEPGESVVLNATVSNIGLNNETDVELILLVNGEEKAYLSIPRLGVGESKTLSYLWEPVEGTYNITAYAPPIPGETDIFNNVKTMFTSVSRAIVVGFIETHGESLHSNDLKSYYESLGYIVNTIRFQLTRELLADYDVLIVGEDWINIPWLSSEIAAVNDFILSGKGFVAIGDELASSVQQILAAYGITYTYSWPYSGSSNNFDHSHPIMQGVQYIYIPNPINSLHITPPGYWIASDVSNLYTIIAGAEVSGRIICISDDLAAYVYSDDNEIMFANIIQWLIPPEHDLYVDLEAPDFLELNDSIQLNATVYNRGLSNETNIGVYLLINGTVVSNATIPELAASESYSINYLWTPVTKGSYNITAYTQPVPEEENTANNIVSKRTIVFFYRQLHRSHEWIGSGDPMDWHGDDVSWQYDLPFKFPFYGIKYETIYVSSNGLITFMEPDSDYLNSIHALASKLAIAPAWDDWVTYDPYGIYIWENSTHVGIQWYVRAYSSSIVANFEAILCVNGVIQFNYAYNDGPVSATIGISNGINHIIAQDLSNLNYIDTIIFTPLESDIAVLDVSTYPHQVYVGQPVNINVTVRNEGESSETFTLEVYYQKAIDANSTFTNPQSYISLFPLEPHDANAMWIEPSVVDATSMVMGDRFNVTVWLNVNVDCSAWQIYLIYEKTYLDVTRYALTGTSGIISQFFEQSGAQTWGILSFEESYNATHDYIRIGEAWKSGPWGTGCGSLAWIEFNITAQPPPTITLDIATAYHPPTSDTCALDPNQNEIPLNVYNCLVVFAEEALPPISRMIGQAEVSLQPGKNKTIIFTWNTIGVKFGNYTIIAVAVPLPSEQDTEDNTFIDGIVKVIWEHDVTIINVSRASQWVYVGRTVNFTVTVGNLGDFVENVTITLYYNITERIQICTVILENLLPGENRTLLISWNTAGVEPSRSYTITVIAEIEKPDNNPSDNIFTNINIQVRILGDMNGDFSVDIRDISSIAKAFGTYPNQPMWNPDADLNNDGRVDIIDICLAVKNFGKRY